MSKDKTVPHETSFHIAGSPSLHSLPELQAYAKQLSIEQFNRQVFQKKGDFAAWVRDVFHEQKLAHDLLACEGKEEFIEALERSVDRASAENSDTSANVISAAPIDDSTFSRVKEEMTVRNENMTKRYELITKGFQEALANAFPKELEKEADLLKTSYDNLAAKISELRRQGKDTLLPALIMKQFQAKLAFARATRNRADFKVAQAILSQVASELEEVKNRKESNVKDEVLALAGVRR
jgi:hypothetical protein